MVLKIIAFDDPEPQLSYSSCTLLPICMHCNFHIGRDCKDDEDKGINNLQVKKRLKMQLYLSIYIK